MLPINLRFFLNSNEMLPKHWDWIFQSIIHIKTKVIKFSIVHDLTYGLGKFAQINLSNVIWNFFIKKLKCIFYFFKKIKLDFDQITQIYQINFHFEFFKNHIKSGLTINLSGKKRNKQGFFFIISKWKESENNLILSK